MMLVTTVLLGFVAVATVTDLRQHKIYNWTTYPGMLIAIAFNALGDLLLGLGFSNEATLSALGYIGLQQSLFGWAVCGFLMVVGFVMLHVRGGDVKLIAMVGAMVGPELGIVILLWTFVLAACAGLIGLIWRLGPVRIASGVWRYLMSVLRIKQFHPLSEEERRPLQAPLYLAPCVLTAVAVVLSGFGV